MHTSLLSILGELKVHALHILYIYLVVREASAVQVIIQVAVQYVHLLSYIQ